MGVHLGPATAVVEYGSHGFGWKEWVYPAKSKPGRVLMVAMVLRPLLLPMEMFMARRDLSVLPHLYQKGRGWLPRAAPHRAHTMGRSSPRLT